CLTPFGSQTPAFWRLKTSDALPETPVCWPARQVWDAGPPGRCGNAGPLARAVCPLVSDSRRVSDTRHAGAQRARHLTLERPQSPTPDAQAVAGPLAGDHGARTQPSMRTRALRDMMALVTFHSPSIRFACAPTRSVPDGWPNRTPSRWPPPAARLTSVPGTAAAVAMATEAVPIIA